MLIRLLASHLGDWRQYDVGIPRRSSGIRDPSSPDILFTRAGKLATQCAAECRLPAWHDQFGRNIYGQLIHGTRSALSVGLSAAIVVANLGTIRPGRSPATSAASSIRCWRASPTWHCRFCRSLSCRPRNGCRARGQVAFKDQAIDETNIRPLLWRDIAYVPQNAMNSLDPVCRVGGQIAEALTKRGNASRGAANAPAGPRQQARQKQGQRRQHVAIAENLISHRSHHAPE